MCGTPSNTLTFDKTKLNLIPNEKNGEEIKSEQIKKVEWDPIRLLLEYGKDMQWWIIKISVYYDKKEGKKGIIALFCT